jgi:hypothetical protein
MVRSRLPNVLGNKVELEPCTVAHPAAFRRNMAALLWVPVHLPTGCLQVCDIYLSIPTSSHPLHHKPLCPPSSRAATFPTLPLNPCHVDVSDRRRGNVVLYNFF